MKAREVNRRIERLGGYAVRQSGSHRIYRATGNGVTVNVPVPQHTGDLKRGTLGSIEKAFEPVFGEGWLV